jgi:hypothetical protein
MIRHKVVKNWLGLGVVFAGSLGLAACDSGGGKEPPVNNADAGMIIIKDPPKEDAPNYHFVANVMNVPKDANLAKAYGTDLDGNGTPDNQLGKILAVLGGQDVDIQKTITESLAMGELILLHNLKTEDIVDGDPASWQVYLGNKTTGTPDFSGTGAFSISDMDTRKGVLTGQIEGGTFTGGPGTIKISLALVAGGDPLIADLVGARITGDVTETGCMDVKVGGGITQNELDTVLIPRVADLMNVTIKSEIGCMEKCMDDKADTKCMASTQTMIDLFDGVLKDSAGMVIPDTAADCTVTVAEIANNDLIKALLKADVDLLDAEGKFNPRVDGKKDSLSLGVQMSCVGAKFTASNEKGTTTPAP